MSQPNWTFLAASLFVSGLTATLAVAKDPEPSWSRLETQLKKAILSRRFDEAKSVVSQLAETGDLKGYEIIMKHALSGHDYGLERHAGALLVEARDPKVRKEVFSTLRKSPNPKIRVVLLAVVSRWADDPEARDALYSVFSTSRTPKEVLFAALYWIRKIRLPAKSVEPLIAALERRAKIQDRVYFDICRTLKRLTGQDLKTPDEWRSFWEGQKGGLSKPIKRKPGRTVLAKKPSFFTIVVDSDRVLFIIDVSTSMEVRDPILEGVEEAEEIVNPDGGPTVVKRKKPSPPKGNPQGEPPAWRARIARVKKELINTVRSLRPHVRFGIMSFSHEIKYLENRKSLASASEDNKTRAIQWVQALKPNGVTRTDEALKQALELPEVDTIYLLTDGAPKNENNERIPPQTIYDDVKRLNRFRKCRIHTIGFSQAGRSMRLFVQQLALMNDGKCVLLN